MPIKTKTIGATDIRFGRLQIWQDNAGDLRYRREYEFVDANGKAVKFEQYTEGAPQTVYDGGIPWSKVPKHIKDVLIEIDEFTKAQIRKQEGVEQ
jgi:hypothetical protein